MTTHPAAASPPRRGPHHGTHDAPPRRGGVVASSLGHRHRSRLGRDAPPELSALLVRPDRQPDRRLDAVGCAAMARAPARRVAVPARTRHGLPVRPVDDRGAARWRPRRSRRQAADADHRQRRGHAPGIGPLRPHPDGRDRDLADLRTGPGCGRRRSHRDAAAPGIRGGARAARGSRQRDRPELDVVQPLARHRSRRCRPDDRRVRRGQQLRDSTLSATSR